MSDTPESAPETPKTVPAEAVVVIQDDPARAEAKGRRIALMQWLMDIGEGINAGRMLVSRPNENYMWQQTGVIVDHGVVSAKFGHHPYQKIGTEDGVGFYPTDGSKLIWAHDFAFAALTPIEGPFKVQKKQGIVDLNESTETALSDKERTAMTEAFSAIGDALKEYSDAREASNVNPLTPEIVASTRDKLLNTIKYYAIGIARIDRQLQELAAKNPDFKQDLSGVDPRTLAEAITEFIRMKLNDDAMRRYHAEHEMVASAEPTVITLLDKCMVMLAATVPAEGREWDAQRLVQVLQDISVAYPATVQILEPFFETDELEAPAKAVLIFLQQERDRLAQG